MVTVVTNSVGPGKTYTTAQSWEDAKPSSLTAVDQIWRGEAYAGAELSGFVVSGSTTDATRYCQLVAAAGESIADHASKLTNALRYDASKGAALRSTTAWGSAITISENYFRLERMQVQHDNSNGNAITGAGTNVTIDQCIVEAKGGKAADLNTGAVLKNSLLISRKGGTDCIVALWNSTVANCIFAAPSDITPPTYGIRRNYWSAFTAVNLGIFGAASLATSTTGGTFTNCATDRSSPPSGFTTVAYDTSTGSGFENTTNGTHDYRIKSTSALKDAGTATGAPSTDIVGTTRPQGGSYDIGVWEYAAAGSTARTATTSLSAAIQLAQQLSASTSVAVQASQAVSTTVQTAVQAATAASAQLDAAVAQARTGVASVQAAVQASGTQSTSLQAAVSLARAAALSLELAVQSPRAATSSVSLQVLAASQQQAAVDLYVQAGSTASTQLSLAVLRQALAAADLSLAVQLPGTVATSATTAVQVARSATAVLDIALQQLRSAAASVDLQVQAGTSALASIDMAVRQAQAATAAVQLAVAQAAQAQLSVSAALQVQRLLTSAVDAAVMVRAAASVGLSLYVDDGSVLRPGLRHLWAHEARRDLWPRAARRDLWAKPERGGP